MDLSPTAQLRDRDDPAVGDVGVRAGAWAGLAESQLVLILTVGLLFPFAAGVLVFGWRAAAGTAFLLASSLLAAWMWRRVGRRGRTIHFSGVAVLATLLAMTLPPHLLTTSWPVDNGRGMLACWPILPAAGFTLVMLAWLLGGSHRVHPVLLTNLILVVFFPSAMEPRNILQRDRLLTGDVLVVSPPLAGGANANSRWIDTSSDQNYPAVTRESAAAKLTFFTSGREPPERAWLSMETLLRDRLPPLEDLFVAGDPRPLGMASAVAVVIGGLFLLYRGAIDYRIPLLLTLGAWLALLVLPVPIVITESGPDWRWFSFRPSAATWPVAVTFANYEVLASPLVFAALFLATSSSLRPMSRRWRPIYALLAGVLSAAAQLYIGVSIGPYVALLLLSLLVPSLDNRYRAAPGI